MARAYKNIPRPKERDSGIYTYHTVCHCRDWSGDRVTGTPFHQRQFGALVENGLLFCGGAFVAP